MFHSLTRFGDLRRRTTSCWRREILGLKPRSPREPRRIASSIWVRNATIDRHACARLDACRPRCDQHARPRWTYQKWRLVTFGGFCGKASHPVPQTYGESPGKPARGADLVDSFFANSGAKCYHSWRLKAGMKPFQRRLTDRFLRLHCRMLEKFSPEAHTTFFDPSAFSWVANIATNWRRIRADLERALMDRDAIPTFYEVSDRQALFSQIRWQVLFFYVYGRPVPENCTLYPDTASIVQGIPGMTTAMFSILPPGAHLSAHTGPNKGVLRYHLGLIVPVEDQRCRIRVGCDVRTWAEGQSLIFDDTFEHEVWNSTDKERVVLFVDFLRPVPAPLAILNRTFLSLIKLLARDVAEAQTNARRYASHPPPR